MLEAGNPYDDVKSWWDAKKAALRGEATSAAASQGGA